MNQQRIVIDYTCGVGLFRKFAYITSVGKPIFLCVLWAVYISAVSLSRAFKKNILGLLLHPVGALFSNMFVFFAVFLRYYISRRAFPVKLATAKMRCVSISPQSAHLASLQLMEVVMQHIEKWLIPIMSL